MRQITANKPVKNNNQEGKEDDRYRILKGLFDQFNV